METSLEFAVLKSPVLRTQLRKAPSAMARAASSASSEPNPYVGLDDTT